MRGNSSKVKGIILAAGSSKSLELLTNNKPVALLEVLGIPLIEYQFRMLRDHEIRDIYVVVNKGDNSIKELYGNGTDLGIHINYIVQNPKVPGIDGAVLSVKEIFNDGSEQFVMLHVDTITDSKILTRTLNALDNLGADMALSVVLEKKVSQFGVVGVSPQGLVEKIYPEGERDEGNYIVSGVFVLTADIFNYLKPNVPFNQSLNHFIENDGKIACGVWNEPWVDVGRPWNLLRANKMILGTKQVSIIHPETNIEGGTQIIGPVIIEKGVTILHGSVIRGPVYIGENTFIGNNSLVRKDTIIEKNSVIGMGVEVKGSLVMEGSTVSRQCFVGDSIVGKKAVVQAGCVTVNKIKGQDHIFALVDGKKEQIPTIKFGAVFGTHSVIWPNVTSLPGTLVNQNVTIGPNQVIRGTISDNIGVL